jgi:hypothetical protein
MKKKETSKQLQAKLDFAEQVNEYFPFLKGKYKILTGITVDPNGNESGTLGIEIFSDKKEAQNISLETFFRERIKKVLTAEVLNQNEKLRYVNSNMEKTIDRLERQVKKLKKKK